MENAVQHAMPSEGKLTITVTGEVEGDDVYLRVSDNGTRHDRGSAPGYHAS